MLNLQNFLQPINTASNYKKVQFSFLLTLSEYLLDA